MRYGIGIKLWTFKYIGSNRKKDAILAESANYSEYFGSTKISVGGQVTIPVKARKVLGLKAGDRLFVVGCQTAKGVVMLKIDSLRDLDV